MSTAWKLPVVLWREPWKAVSARIVGRAIVPAVGLWLSGVPGTPWTGTINWLILRVPVFVVAAVALLLWVFAICNICSNRRVVLRCMPTGSIERPRSLQERLLKIPQEYAIGKTITVAPEHPQFMSQAEPRVTLSAEGMVKRIPLHGTSVEDFVAEVNGLLKGRGVKFVVAEPEGPPGYGEPLEGLGDAEPSEGTGP
ncbi:MAG: hypothetical protein MUP36_01165 [Demequinaceae bacterium]|nr:hypothetical protein [Demequinaceae bacterium]